MNAAYTFIITRAWSNHREAKLHSSKILPEALPESSQIATVQCNSNGSRVSIIVEQVRIQQFKCTHKLATAPEQFV